MHNWCFDCRHFARNRHADGVDPEMWLRQARSATVQSDAWRLPGETVVGVCAKSGADMPMGLAATEDCPGWQNRLTAAEAAAMRKMAEDYEAKRDSGIGEAIGNPKSFYAASGDALLDTVARLLPGVRAREEELRNHEETLLNSKGEMAK